MADVELEYNGVSYPIVEADLLLKRVGNWTAYLNSIDMDQAPTGLCKLKWQGTSFQAIVLRSGITENRVSAILVGGFGALDQEVTPQMFDYQFPLSLPVSKSFTEVGQKLVPPKTYADLFSSDSQQALLSMTMNTWPRVAGTLASTLDALCDAFNLQNKVSMIWRIGIDGKVFFGQDLWTPAEPFQHEILRQSPALNSITISAESIGLLPGQTYLGPPENPFTAKIGAIHYVIRAGSSRAKVYFQDDMIAENPLKSGMIALIRETMRGTEWYKVYPGSVIQQRNDGSLDVHLDNPDLPILTSVRLRVPVPNSKIVLNGSEKVAIIFSEGNPSVAEAWLWGSGTNAKAVVRVGDKGVAGSLSMAGVQTGPLCAVTFTYTDPDSTPIVLGVLTVTGGFVPNPMSLGTANLITKATEGSAIFFIP